MAEPYSTLLDPTRSLDNVLNLGYNPEALGVLSGAPIRWGNQPSGISGGARDSGEHNILSIQNTLETAADPGLWDSLKDYFRIPWTGDRIIPTAEDNLNMARMLGIPGTPDYGGGIAEQSAKQILPVMEGMTNQEPEPEGGMWNSIRDFFIQPAGAQSDVPDEDLFWVPPLKGKPVYPPGFRQETIDILEDNPGLDSDMVRHYVRGKEIGEKWGPTLGSIGGYAKEAVDWMWPGSRAGFSLDDLLASEAGIKGKSVQEALDAGVFKHTEPGITGYGQGLWDDVSRKAETLGIDLSPAERLKGFVDSPFRMQHEARGPSGPSRQRGGYIGVTPLPRGIGWRSPASSLISHADSGVGVEEIPTTVDVMPVISPRADFRSNMPVYDSPAVSFSRATPQVFYTDSGPMPTQEQIDISVENLGRLHREAQQAGPMESQVSQALSDYAFGRDVQPELQAIAELTDVDPTFNFEKYLDPASQEIMDITSQVDSFANIPEAPWTPPAPVIPDIVVPPPARDEPEPQVEDFSAIQEADRSRQERERKAEVKKAASAARKKEAKREADTKKKAAEQRAKLDSASKKALEAHMKWMETQSKRVAKEEKKRAKRYAGGTGGALMWT